MPNRRAFLRAALSWAGGVGGLVMVVVGAALPADGAPPFAEGGALPSGDETMRDKALRILQRGLVPPQTGNEYRVFQSTLTTPRPDWTADDLRFIKFLPTLERAVLDGNLAGDAALLEISQCRNLVFVSLWGSSVTDRGIAFLQSLPRLKELTIFEEVDRVGYRDTDVHLSPEGLDGVVAHGRLRHLELRGSFVDSELVEYLAIPSSVQTLTLGHGPFAKRGLERLRKNPSLEQIFLVGVTKDQQDWPKIFPDFSHEWLYDNTALLLKRRPK